jgi:DNA-binding SARP family transcriptional activator
VRYEILGPIRIADGDRFSFIGARKVEILLAVLLARADQVVTTDQLIGEIWGEEIPRRAIAVIHVYISQIRKFLSSARRSESPIVTRPPGYLLRLEADELDCRSFQQLVNQGRNHTREQRPELAAKRFESALALWRGPVFGDLSDGPILGSFATWLTEARLECIEMLIDTQLTLGRHRELIGRLYSLTTEHPLREVFYRQLMLALYRSERQADALSVYQSARRTLNDELGIEPCRPLRDLQRAILMADDQLDLAPRSAEAVPA